MRSADKYRLVVDDDDLQAVQNSSTAAEASSSEDTPVQKGTPMFAIRGLEVSLGTSKGPVNFVPLFFSRTELQKVALLHFPSQLNTCSQNRSFLRKQLTTHLLGPP